jgi:hypothetical protein
MNKKVTVNGQVYEMYQVKMTNWVFVRSHKTKKTYSIAKIINNEIVTVDSEPALPEVSNQELAEAWVKAE